MSLREKQRVTAPLCRALATAVDGLRAHSNPQSNPQSNSGIERALVVAMSTLPLALALVSSSKIKQDKNNADDERGNDSENVAKDISNDDKNGGSGSSSSEKDSGDDGERLLSSLITLLRAYWTACAKHGPPSLSNTNNALSNTALSNSQ